MIFHDWAIRGQMKLSINLCRIIFLKLENNTQTIDAVLGSELGTTVQERLHGIVLGNVSLFDSKQNNPQHQKGKEN